MASTTGRQDWSNSHRRRAASRRDRAASQADHGEEE
jgi:hypothetical protein